MIRAHKTLVCVSILTLVVLAVVLRGQGTAPASPLLILTTEGRTPLRTVMVSNQEMVALDELASVFKLAVREDTVTNAVRVTYRDKAILLTPDQTLVSVAGRLVSLPAPLSRSGRRSGTPEGHWLVPVEFINRAFALIYEQPIELRKASRMLIVGTLKVPRVAVHYETLGSDLRVAVDITPTVGHAIVQEARRLLVRLEADAIDPAIGQPPSQNLLAGVKVLDRQTIELTLGPRFGSYRSSLPDSTPASSRVLLDLLPPAPEVTAAPATPPPTLTPAPAADPLPTFTPQRPAIRTIVIDPGHGGEDAGARGPAGGQEKDVTLAVARRLKSAIEGRYGLRVLQTRDDDRLIGPDGRAAYANNNKADLFISLHANASRQPAAKGVEIFYLGLDRYGDEARRQAHLEGGVLPVFGGGSREVELVLWDLAQARHVDRSAVLAGIVESQLRSKVEISPLATQQGPMRGLAGVNMPAVLIEMGYLTNPAQERALRSEAYQTLIAQALTDAVAAFRDFTEGSAGDEAAQSASPPASPAALDR